MEIDQIIERSIKFAEIGNSYLARKSIDSALSISFENNDSLQLVKALIRSGREYHLDGFSERR